MPSPLEAKPSILAQGEALVKTEVATLGPDDKAAVAIAADHESQRIGAAVDLGKGFAAGGHVERVNKKVGWFAGLTKRWKKGT